MAGGIGISPFLAILSDIINRVRDGKPCLPKRILVVWAVKKSDELSLLSTINTEACPLFSDKVNLEIDVYVTRESQPSLVGLVNAKLLKLLFPPYIIIIIIIIEMMLRWI